MGTSSPGAGRADTAARAQNLISMAYQLPLASRTEWLRAQCSDDEPLRREVSWMLEALRAPDTAFLEGRPSVDALDAMPDEISVPAPRDYRIVRPLGEGGMGTVYLAERFDGDYTQSVAVKFLNSFALVNPAVVSRFVDERRILAQLSHPNIAHLVDGGTLGDGRPFLAMEYVDGVRIDQDCDARELSQRRRLIQFLKVCGGVDYAHQRLIIHRDIKPANILVGADGEPKLLDFGIARLIDVQGEQTRTEAGLRMMTLAYASPEQIAGEVLTTATDIYSLGVLLYELLTGSRPWRDDVSAAELARQITEGEATPPSVIARRNGTHRPIDGDLDAIVLKTLRKEPSQRYSSVRELSDDIRNYLDSRPVLARRGHRLYRVRKFTYRHRYALTMVTVVLALVIGSLWNRQLQVERIAAEAAVSRQVTDLMLGSFAAVDPVEARGRAVTAREVLDRAATEAARVTAQPIVRARLFDAIGRAYHQIGAAERAVESYRQAVAAWRQVDAPPDTALPASLLGLARALGEIDRLDDSMAAVDEALALRDRPGITRDALLSALFLKKAQLYQDRAIPRAQVERYYQRAVALAAGDAVAAGDAHANYASWAARIDAKLARREADNAMRVTASLDEASPTRFQARVALAAAARRAGDHALAIATTKASYDIAKRVFAPDSLRLALQAFAYGTARLAALDYAGAEAPLREAADIYRAHLSLGMQESLIRALGNLEVAVREQRRFDESATMLAELLQLTRDKYGKRDFRYAYALWSSGNLELDRDAPEAALARYTESESILADAGEGFATDRAVVTAQRATALNALRRYADAAAAARESQAHFATLPDTLPGALAQPDIELAIAEVGLGRVDAGNARLAAAFTVVSQESGACDPATQSLRAKLVKQRDALPELWVPDAPTCPDAPAAGAP